jgi:DNA polymerase-3 subunit gamma/tau
MAYTVLARRYRPQSFDECIGQEAVARTLRNAIASDRVAHAYLFTGTRGVGKTTMARILAKALNCEKGPTADPCGKCESCRRTQEGDDLDVIEIDGASNTGVDNIRDLRSGAVYAPARSRFKIYIIDEVHMLSTGAFNALLKTLEEPPEHVKFIFATTDPQKVPGTIHSRCQRFDFRSVPTDTIADYLQTLCQKEKVKADRDALRVIAREGRGSVRDALTILDQAITLCDGKVELAPVLESLGLADSQRYFDLADALAAGDAAKALGLLDSALAEGTEPSEFVEHLMDHMRSLLLVKAVGPEAPGLEVTKEERAKLVEQSARFTVDSLTVAVELCGATRSRVRGITHPRPLVELALIQLARMPDFASIRETLERLGPGAIASRPATANSAAPATSEAEKKNDKPLTPAPSAAAPSRDASSGDVPPDDEGGWVEGEEPPSDTLPVEPVDVLAASSNVPPSDGGDESDAAPLTESISAEEQKAVREDPKVQRILSLFDGRIVGMSRARKDV